MKCLEGEYEGDQSKPDWNMNLNVEICHKTVALEFTNASGLAKFFNF